MEPLEKVEISMEDYCKYASEIAQSVANTICFERQSVTNVQMEALAEANAGLQAANNVLVEIRRMSDTPLSDRIGEMLDSALRLSTSRVETLRIYNDVIKVLNG